jgi:hypothetical protein
VNASELLMDDYVDNYESFSSNNGWLRSNDLDKLSKEEAGIIAEQILRPIKVKSQLDLDDEAKLREKITATFTDFFLNYKSLEELGDPEVYKTKLGEIFDYGEELLGNGNMPPIDELWNACSSVAKNCNHEGCSSSCKLPKKS